MEINNEDHATVTLHQIGQAQSELGKVQNVAALPSMI